MSKKSILSTLLISSALLGTISATAATSAVRPEKKLVTIEKKEAKVYKNSKLKTANKMKKGTVYKVNGYRLINKKHYYRVYQEDKKGKLVYKGYLLDKDTKVVEKQNPSKKDRLVTLTKNDQPAWKNLYFNTKVATYDGKKHTSNFEVKSIYHINDKKYFSLYRGEKWMGYMDASAFKVLAPKTLAKDKQNYRVVKSYETYRDLFFTKNGKLKAGKDVKVKAIYTVGSGRKYGSIYNEEGKWLGYANMNALEAVKVSKPSEPDIPTKPETKPEQPETKPETKPEIPDENPNASLEELIKGVKEQAKQVYLSTTQQKKLNQFLDTVEKISSSDKEAISDAKSDLRQTKRELINSPSLEDVNIIVAQYKQMEEKCADWDWEESRYQNLFTKSQRKAFVNGLNAITTVGEAVAEDEKVTVDQVEAAKKAEKAAKALKFNTKLLEKMYNQPAEALITTTKDFEATLKELGYKYQNTDKEQKVVAKDLEEAKKVLAKHASAIDGTKWNTKNWQAIVTVEKKVEEDARKLSDKLNKNFTSTYEKLDKQAQYLYTDYLKELLEKCSSDSINGNYNSFKQDILDLTKAIKEGKENGVKEARELEDLMDDIRRIDHDVIDPRTSAAKQVDTLWEQAEEMVNNARFYSKESVVKMEEELEKTIKTLTLNIEGLKELGQTFKMMVGENGQGGTYILSNDQKEELINRSASLKDIYQKAMSNNTMKNYENFSKCWDRLNDAIRRVKDSCIPTNKSELGQLVQEVQKLGLRDRWDDFYLVTKYIIVDTEKNRNVTKAYKKAKDILNNDNVSKEESKQAENNLRNAVLAIKLNVPKLKELGQKFQTMVGSEGQEGTYQLTKEQKEELKQNGQKLEELYQKGISKDTLDNFESFKSAYDTLSRAIDHLKNNCTPKDKESLSQLVNDVQKLERYDYEIIRYIVSDSEKNKVLNDAYEKAKDVMRNDNSSKEEIKQAEDNLRQAVLAIKLNVPKLKELGQKFQEMVGSKGQEGTYQLSDEQKEELKQNGNKLEELYQKGISKDTLDNFESFKLAYDSLNRGIDYVKRYCTPKDKKDLVELVKQISNLGYYKLREYILSDSEKSKALNDAYKKAEDVLDNDNASKKQIDEVENNLRNAVLSIKLNVPKLKELGKKFQEMIGKNGTGGTYYIDKEQTKELTLNLKGIDKKYNQIIKDDNLKNIGEFVEVYRTLEQAIGKIENNCPKMTDINTVISYGKELNKVKDELEKTSNHSRFFSSDNWLYSFNQINEIINAKKVQQSIKSYTVYDILSIGKELEKITMNIKALDRLNYDVYQYVKDAQKQANSKKDSSVNGKAKVVVEALKAVAPILENQNNIRIMNPKGDSFVWNTAGLKKACEAEDKVKKALKELVDEVKKEKLTVTPGYDLQRDWGDLFQDQSMNH